MIQTTTATLVVTSTKFKDGGEIPKKYTCDGENVNPPLKIQDIPENTQSMVLIVDDPDAPVGTWDHWIVWNIPPKNQIKENSVPGKEGINSFVQHSYGGPCPPSGTHRYFFKIYALDKKLNLNDNVKKPEVEKAMSGHILASGKIVGVYKRQ